MSDKAQAMIDELVPSFNDKTWRLHSGKDAKIIYEWTPEKEREQ